jgi:hypothetical protein
MRIFLMVCLMLLVLPSWVFAQKDATGAPEQPKKEESDQTWKLYMESAAKKYYFSPATIQRFDKRKIRVWEKITTKNKDSESDLVKSLFEFDCSSSKYRIVASVEYEAATGAEKPQVISQNEPWQYFSHETILGILYDNVCYQGGEKIQDTSKPAKPKKEEKKP